MAECNQLTRLPFKGLKVHITRQLVTVVFNSVDLTLDRSLSYHQLHME